MTKYIVLYHADESAAEQMAKATPEEMEAGMEPWMAWAGKCGDSLVDIGSPLANAKAVDESGASDSGSTVVGYSVLEAGSIDEAVRLLDGHPHLGWTDGCSIEVHESMPLPGIG